MFLPHRESSVNNNNSSSPREDKRKSEEEDDSFGCKVPAAKKQRVQASDFDRSTRPQSFPLLSSNPLCFSEFTALTNPSIGQSAAQRPDGGRGEIVSGSEGAGVIGGEATH